jgi:hypothetical protein
VTTRATEFSIWPTLDFFQIGELPKNINNTLHTLSLQRVHLLGCEKISKWLDPFRLYQVHNYELSIISDIIEKTKCFPRGQVAALAQKEKKSYLYLKALIP